MVAQLTKIFLEEDLRYRNAVIQQVALGLGFEGVGSGDLGGFQDVWLPTTRSFPIICVKPAGQRRDSFSSWALCLAVGWRVFRPFRMDLAWTTPNSASPC